jgi:hypothetical protein
MGNPGTGHCSGSGRLLASTYLREGLRELMGIFMDEQQAIYPLNIAKGSEIRGDAATPAD